MILDWHKARCRQQFATLSFSLHDHHGCQSHARGSPLGTLNVYCSEGLCTIRTPRKGAACSANCSQCKQLKQWLLLLQSGTGVPCPCRGWGPGVKPKVLLISRLLLVWCSAYNARCFQFEHVRHLAPDPAWSTERILRQRSLSF